MDGWGQFQPWDVLWCGIPEFLVWHPWHSVLPTVRNFCNFYHQMGNVKERPRYVVIFIESVTLAMLLATNSTTASSVMFGKSFLHTFFSIIGKNCVIFCSLSGGPFVVLVNCCFCWDSIHCVSIRFQCQWSVNTHILIDVPPGGEVKEETEIFFSMAALPALKCKELVALLGAMLGLFIKLSLH